ncbi:hypothetical protein HD553DRAFT_324584 [Filobasidium floriforme]|uniref:uncharacterized protein n=1 Tax=Filobasidium floriforme TaxID=5210 RepID=UPI001E8CC921|nr:uncharacterized protein HD553DRAFT_324584 [Filobasidium floriforme]KAH8083715.1 hypothetical protein HD553DRAFT_324584 [Filobasidium floriforme]
MTSKYESTDNIYANGISCIYSMEDDKAQLEVHTIFGSNRYNGRLQIRIFVRRLSKSSEPTTTMKLHATEGFHESLNDYRDGGNRLMGIESLSLFGYWLDEATSTHAATAKTMIDWFKGNNFKSALKPHMESAIKEMQKKYPRRKWPPLPIDSHENKPDVHSDNGGSDSMGSAENSDEAPSHAETAGTSSGNSGQLPDSTLDTQVCSPEIAVLVTTSDSPYDSDRSAFILTVDISDMTT